MQRSELRHGKGTKMHRLTVAAVLLLAAVVACGAPQEYDVVIRNGTIYDGSGGAPYQGDLAIHGDTIAAVGDLGRASGRTEIEATGLAVSPGFINMLSWANESLIEDGLGQSDIRQGVTLEVFGEGSSMGPLNEVMKEERLESQGDIRYAGRVDDARRIPGLAGRPRGGPEHRLVRRSDHGAHPRARLRGPGSHGSGARPHAGPRGAGDGGGRAGCGVVADLRARLLRGHRRADRAGRGGRRTRRNVHQPHQGRGKQAPGECRRIDHHRPGGRCPRRDLPPEGVGPGQLGQAEGRHPPRGRGAGRGPQDHRRHVHLPREFDRTQRGDAAVGAGGRVRRLGRAAAGPGDPGTREGGDERSGRTSGTTRG